MKQLNEWLFEISVPKGKDAHYTLVHWLRRNGLSDLFSENYKAITYVVFQYGDDYGLIGKSSVPIKHPIVEHNEFAINLDKPIRVVVQLSTKKRIKTPNLKHEAQTSPRYKNSIRLMNQAEKKVRVHKVMDELGFDPSSTNFEIHEGIDVPIYHKRDNLFIVEPTMNVIFEGLIIHHEKFDSAWNFGVGNKRVYGLGCVRVLHD